MCIQPPASDNGSIHRWLAAWVQHTAGCDAAVQVSRAAPTSGSPLLS